MKTCLIAICWMSGCRMDGTVKGTVVGNPGDNAMRIADGSEVEILSARTVLESIELTACGGGVERLSVGTSMDLLGDNRFPMVQGEWCQFDARFSEPLQLELRGTGFSDSEESVRLSLNLESIGVGAAAGFSVADTGYVLELGAPGWLTTASMAGETALLIESVIDGTALYEDVDGDGEVSDSERRSGAAATGEEWLDDEDEGEDEDEDEDEDEGEDEDEDEDEDEGDEGDEADEDDEDDESEE